MRIKAYKKMICVLMLAVSLLGVLSACSNSNNDPNNVNKQVRKNNDLLNESVSNDEESDEHDSQTLNIKLTDDQEQGTRVENESIEQHVEHESNDANNTLDDSTIAADDNTSADSSPTVPFLPQEPNDQQSEEPTDKPDANTSDGRPTLLSPVDSDDDPRTLMIGMFSVAPRHETALREVFTRSFEWDYPAVEIEFTSVTDVIFDHPDQLTIDTTAELRKLMTGDNPPDVVFLGYNDYYALMKEGLLVALDPFFVDSELSHDDFEPIVSDGLVHPQDGQTYGLSPYFTANALIYNKDLFDEMKIPYPRDHMTWDEVFTLAKQMTFRSEERNVYGFAFDILNHRVPGLHDLWRRYADSYEVQIYDRATGKAAVNNEEWAEIFLSTKDLYDAGVFPTSEESETAPYQGRNKFYSNTIAMGIVQHHELRQIIEETIAGELPVPNWDIVSVPVHPANPYVGAGVVMDPVIAINANGRNQLDAWRLIESIHSPEWASMNAERLVSYLLSRKDHGISLVEMDYNKSALYQLRPSRYYTTNFPHTGLVSPYTDFIMIGEFSYSDFLSGELDVQEALERWEFVINNYDDLVN